MKKYFKIDPQIWFIIGWLITIFILVVIFSSCKPTLQQCNQLYPPQTKDSVSYVEKTKLDTAFFILPGDTTILKVPIPCPDFEAYSKDKSKQTKIIIKDRVLTVYNISKSDSLRIITAYQQSQKSNQKTITVYKDRPVKYVPKWIWIILLITSILSALYIRSFFRK